LTMTAPTIRTDWTREEIAALFDLPFMDLMYEAQTVHRAYHPRNEVQLSTLLSIKTGGCPEDCGYCSQSVEADSGVKATKLMDVRQVLQAAAQAKDNGSGRFCMGAAWRNPKERDMPALVEMIQGVRQMGMETCMTLGMLDAGQAKTLADAGLDYYNHNIDTAPENYANVITTRTFEDRIETLENVRAAGINVCCGGIVGAGRDARGPDRFHPCAWVYAAPRKRADQRAGAGEGHGAGRYAGRYAAGEDRRDRVRAHGCGCADRDAREHGAAERRGGSR
jgi:biotin synthase